MVGGYGQMLEVINIVDICVYIDGRNGIYKGVG